MAGGADLVLIGYGVGDQLQLTVQSSRALARIGRAYALGLPPNLAAYLRSIRVEAIDLVARLAPDQDAATAYLGIAEAILQAVADDPPIAVLTPGNPLLSNAVARFLIVKARERKIGFQVLPAVSPIDAFITTTGLDVGTFGLQVFDARRLVARRRSPDPSVPLLLLQVGGLASGGGITPGSPSEAELQGLVDVLVAVYPGDHPVVHLVNGPGSAQSVVRVPLTGITGLAPAVRGDSMLFLDLIRRVAAEPGGRRGSEGAR
jgi:hypothetical protein